MRIVLLILAFLAAACSAPAQPAPEPGAAPKEESTVNPGKHEAASSQAAVPSPSSAATEIGTFATGCYWCTEAVFQRLDGVISVRSGFTNGTVPNPTYEEVCGGRTGHAEAVEVKFDPTRISYETLLDWFWRMHDPTTLNRQGYDTGTQYRSGIFWHSEAQRAAAEKSKAAAQASFEDPIVTEITKAATFYEADPYHQDYYDRNSDQRYCRAIIAPKLEKLGLDQKK